MVIPKTLPPGRLRATQKPSDPLVNGCRKGLMMRKFGVLFLTVAGLAQAACITAPRAGAGAKAAHGSRAKGKVVTVDDFETGHAVNDASWSPSADSNNLGSVADFKVEPGDAGGKVGHFYGKLGCNVKPWPWA